MRAYWLFLGLMLIIACTPQTQDCDDACMVQRAVDEGDPIICGLFSDTSKQNWCYNEVAVAMGDSSVCENIFDERAEAFCVSAVAVDTDNLDVCKSIEHSPARDSCLFEIAKDRNDPSICGDIAQKKGYGDNCAYDVSKITQDPVGCQYIENVSLARKCYFFRAGENNDTSICDSIIESAFWKDWCKVNIAIGNLDVNICEQADNTSIVSQCKAIVKQEIRKVE